jgi:hypothetical protein
MEPWMWIVVVAALVVVAAVVYWYSHPEYERSVREFGNPRQAAAELERRAERVEHLQIRPLSSEDCARFTETWRSVQALFVDDPARATAAADRLITEVMRVRGYPVVDFEQRAADVSVDHPRVVENYRAAYGIARRSEAGEANTEDLRQAMVHYRALFTDLLETAPGEEAAAEKERPDERVETPAS